MENKTAPPGAMQGLHFQEGVARKTERSEGNPEAQARLQAEVRKEKATQQKLGAFHVDYGAVRKTERRRNPESSIDSGSRHTQCFYIFIDPF